MASNFGISINRNSDNLHLKLFRNFDGISAHELLNALKKVGKMSIVDDHTLQLAIACFETEGLKSLKKTPACWFENNFKQHKDRVKEV